MPRRELSWQAIQAIVGVKLSVEVLRFDDLSWPKSEDSDVEIIEDDSDENEAPRSNNNNKNINNINTIDNPHVYSPPVALQHAPPTPTPSPPPVEPAETPRTPIPEETNDGDDQEPGETESVASPYDSVDNPLDFLEITLSTDSEFTCPDCDQIFPSQVDLANHTCPSRKVAAAVEDRRHGCHVCEQKFTTYWELRKHINSHFPGMLDSKSSYCHLCQKDYTKTGFMNHLRKHTGERPFVCELCRKAFSQSSSLSIHMKFHLNVRKHVCTVCEKKFVTKSELSRHMTVHTKQKSYYCGVCDKAFTRSDNMKKHEKTHG